MDIVARLARDFCLEATHAEALAGAVLIGLEACIVRRAGVSVGRRFVESVPDADRLRTVAEAEMGGACTWLGVVERSMTLSPASAVAGTAAVLGRFGVDGSLGGALGKAILDYVADTAPPDVLDAVISCSPLFGQIVPGAPPNFSEVRPSRLDTGDRDASAEGLHATQYDPPVVPFAAARTE